MDLDAAEIGKLRVADAGVRGDLRITLAKLTLPCAAHLHGRHGTARKAWRAQCQQRAQRHAARYDAPGKSVYAPALLKRLSELAPDAVVACDVGQHQMWVAQHWRMDHPRKHLTSGALGAMGFGIPAAMGAQMQDPDGQVVCVSGDGSILMNIQELATLRRYGLPVKIVLLDNQALGMVRQWQELFFDKRYSEIDLSDNPDFVAVAQSFGIEALHIERADEVDGALQALLAAKGAALLHAAIDTAANVWPLVPPNRSNSEMLDGGDAHDATVPAPAAIATKSAATTTPSPQEA
jgi:acetolactate synthase-1/2/3 large subunit